MWKLKEQQHIGIVSIVKNIILAMLCSTALNHVGQKIQGLVMELKLENGLSVKYVTKRYGEKDIASKILKIYSAVKNVITNIKNYIKIILIKLGHDILSGRVMLSDIPFYINGLEKILLKKINVPFVKNIKKHIGLIKAGNIKEIYQIGLNYVLNVTKNTIGRVIGELQLKNTIFNKERLVL